MKYLNLVFKTLNFLTIAWLFVDYFPAYVTYKKFGWLPPNPQAHFEYYEQFRGLVFNWVVFLVVMVLINIGFLLVNRVNIRKIPFHVWFCFFNFILLIISFHFDPYKVHEWWLD